MFFTNGNIVTAPEGRDGTLIFLHGRMVPFDPIVARNSVKNEPCKNPWPTCRACDRHGPPKKVRTERFLLLFLIMEHIKRVPQGLHSAFIRLHGKLHMHEGLPHIPLEKTSQVCYASACRMGEVMLGLWSVIVARVVLPMCGGGCTKPWCSKRRPLSICVRYRYPGSNRRPSACWADVIATRPYVR